MAILIANKKQNAAENENIPYFLGSLDDLNQFVGIADQREDLVFSGPGDLEIFDVSSGDRFYLNSPISGWEIKVNGNVVTLVNDTRGQTVTLMALSDGESMVVGFNNGGSAFQEVLITAEDVDGSTVYTATIGEEDLILDSELTTLANAAPVTDDVEVEIDEDDEEGVEITLSARDEDGEVESFIIESLPDGGTLFLDGEEVEQGDVIEAVDGEAALTFVPGADFDGEVEFDYAAVDERGLAEESPATVIIVVNPVNDAPLFELTAAEDLVVEDDPATVVGLVVATYTEPEDEEGDAVTVAFTEGTNDEGYYELDAVTREVKLTQAGVDFVNDGGVLPKISLTATDDGEEPAETVATATPETMRVNDAPVFKLTAEDPVVEDDPAVVVGLVVATYTEPMDDEGDAVTVDFTEGTNDEGYYELDAVTREVKLTQAGVDFVNDGGVLPKISLTATDDGEEPAETVATATPETTLVNDDPTDIALSNQMVEENAAGGTVIGTLSATDADVGDTFTFSLVAGANGADADNDLVEIDGDKLKVKSGAMIDFETNPTLEVNVQVTDSDNATFTKALVIGVMDVDGINA